MENIDTNFEAINLLGYKIHIYPTKIKIYNLENIPAYQFKEITNRLVNYLMDEAFVERKKIKIEIVTFPEAVVVPVTPVNPETPPTV